MRKITRALVVVFISICLFCPMADALSISITSPSEENTKQVIVAPKRDFYVRGAISRDIGDPVSFDIRVLVYSGDSAVGEPVRDIQSVGINDEGITAQDSIYFDYPNCASWSDKSAGKIAKDPPPDLVPGNEASLKQQWCKLAVTKTNYTALVFGGCTNSFDIDIDHVDEDLEAGDYLIVVNAYTKGETDVPDIIHASADLKLKVGVTPDKILARFSPDDHINKVKDFAGSKYRIYMNDYFPGYWRYGGNSYEIPQRWRPNDSIEYKEGNVHTVLYNIDNDRCATQKVEIGYLAKLGALSSDRVKFYYYDIGEPSVTYTGGSKQGNLVELAKGKFFELVRLEYRNAGIVTSDNIYYNFKDFEKTVQMDISSVLKVEPGGTTSLFGVSKPIPANVTEGTGNDNGGLYHVDNLIDTIHYALKDGKKVILSCDKKIGLERWLTSTDKWATYPSVYEYKHDFVFSDELRGKTLTLDMYAYTSLDKTTEIASKSYTLQVGDKSSSSGGGCNAGWALLLIFAATPFALRRKED